MNTGKPWAGVGSGLHGVECWVSVMAFRGAVIRRDSPSIQIPIATTSSPLISIDESPVVYTDLARLESVGLASWWSAFSSFLHVFKLFVGFHSENCIPFKGDRIVQ